MCRKCLFGIIYFLKKVMNSGWYPELVRYSLVGDFSHQR
ncbi:hypothetical protein H206_05238 [Candidatus Electrothrix aarhusensis]|uniref:Uncharacterized protein n=1 Tax=Candidatus Electrothrix aarhusensis TaxID=1859131 RepID=A0A444J571_9BACT|nr:hypothetical protein H206_05238 [Candidatus Electrothrix aarhusensis]